LKILILKPSSLGDVIQALPVLRLLKLHFRDAEIFWWIDSALAPLLENDPDLAGIFLFERKRWAKIIHWPEMFRSIRALRGKNFDLVIDLQCLLRSAIFAWLARGKNLIGLDEIREGACGFYDLAVPRKSFFTHAVDWYLSVLPPLGVPVHKNFTWLPEHKQIADELKQKWFGELQNEKFQSQSFSQPSTFNLQLSTKLILLQPGARWENKRWPVEYFSELVLLLIKKFPDARFVILGGNDDKNLGEKILQNSGTGVSPKNSFSGAGILPANSEAKDAPASLPKKILNLCGQTSLPETIEWIRLCDLMITNDTGPMHVAAALSKPLVALFGPTEPRRTGPYGQLENVLRIDLPCSPCLKSFCTWKNPNECLTAISPATVFEFAIRRLDLR
jgi:heptosyltransferase-1